MTRGHANLTAVEPDDARPDRDAKHADERERLYRAGWVVLRRNGYANAGITEILGEAGLGTRAFYRHFDSRDQLVSALFLELARGEMLRLREGMGAAADPCRAP